MPSLHEIHIQNYPIFTCFSCFFIAQLGSRADPIGQRRLPNLPMFGVQILKWYDLMIQWMRFLISLLCSTSHLPKLVRSELWVFWTLCAGWMRADIMDRLFIRKDFVQQRFFSGQTFCTACLQNLMWTWGLLAERPSRHALFAKLEPDSASPDNQTNQTVPVRTMASRTERFCLCVSLKRCEACAWCVFQILNVRPSIHAVLYSHDDKERALMSVRLLLLFRATTNYCLIVHATIYNKAPVWNCTCMDLVVVSMPKSTKVLVRCLLKVLSRRKFRNLVIKHDSKTGHMDLTLAPLWNYSGISDEDGDTDRCPQEEALKTVLEVLGLEELEDVRNMKGVNWTLGIERLLCPRSTIPVEFNTRKTAWNRPRDQYHRFCEYWVSYLLMIS